MKVTVTGRVVDEALRALPNLSVEARGDWLLTTKQLGSIKTNNEGRFTLAGSTHLWIGRRKQIGRGEGSSGLRFDIAG